MDLEAQYTYSPQKNIKNIVNITISFLILFLCVLAIIFTLNSNMRSELSFIFLYLEGLALGVGIYIFAMKIREFLYKKTVKVTEIISTKL